MSQVLNQETVQTDEFYQQEIHKMLAEMSRRNEKMNHDQEEIDWLKKQSAESLRRIQVNLEMIEKVLN